MDWDRSEGKWKERRQLEGESNSSAPVRRSFTEQYSAGISQSVLATTELHTGETHEWRPCPYCGHGYRNNTRFERHLGEHHGPELRVEGAIRGRVGGA